jgi:hypothetical protein
MAAPLAIRTPAGITLRRQFFRGKDFLENRRAYLGNAAERQLWAATRVREGAKITVAPQGAEIARTLA